MSIKHINFIPGVSVSVGTRDITAINSFSADKHGKDLDVEMTMAEVKFYVKVNGERTGHRIRVPITAIASIHESVDPKEKAK